MFYLTDKLNCQHKTNYSYFYMINENKKKLNESLFRSYLEDFIWKEMHTYIFFRWIFVNCSFSISLVLFPFLFFLVFFSSIPILHILVFFLITIRRVTSLRSFILFIKCIMRVFTINFFFSSTHTFSYTFEYDNVFFFRCLTSFWQKKNVLKILFVGQLIWMSIM